MAKLSKKSKEELDILTFEEVDNYRYDYVLSLIYPFTDDENIYLKELEFYKDVRFKKEKIDRLNKMIVDADSWEKEGKDLEDIDYRAKCLIREIGSDELYQLMYESDFKKLTPFKFIQIC